jgi:hypothetical protein
MSYRSLCRSYASVSHALCLVFFGNSQVRSTVQCQRHAHVCKEPTMYVQTSTAARAPQSIVCCQIVSFASG